MNNLGFSSLNRRHFLTQLARNAYLSGSMENVASDDKPTKQLVKSLAFNNYLPSLCFSMSWEPHGARQAAGHPDNVVEMTEIENTGPVCMFYLFRDFKLFYTYSYAPWELQQWFFEVLFFSLYPSASHFLHLHKGFLMAEVCWLLLEWPGHRNQHWCFPTVLNGRWFMPSGCKGAVGFQAVEKGRQVPHPCQTWIVILVI